MFVIIELNFLLTYLFTSVFVYFCNTTMVRIDFCEQCHFHD